MSETRAAETITVIVPVVIDVQRLRDLLVGAIEGGSGYWARFKVYERSPDLDYLKVEVIETESHKDDGPGVRMMLTPEDLAKGIERLGACAVSGMFADGMKFPAATFHLANFLGENDDAETADVVLQMTVFGTLIYG